MNNTNGSTLLCVSINSFVLNLSVFFFLEEPPISMSSFSNCDETKQLKHKQQMNMSFTSGNHATVQNKFCESFIVLWVDLDQENE